MRINLNLVSPFAKAFFVGGALVLGACTMDASELDTSGIEMAEAPEGDDSAHAEDAQIDEEDVASTEQAVVWGWTPYTSEENPPIMCDGSSLVAAVQCSGAYCDNTRFLCQPTGGSRGSSYWTSYFSEEGTNYRDCAPSHWITGLACKGGWCDNVSLQCSYMGNITPVNCYWTGWVSEEGGGLLQFGTGYYARSVQCSGANCDNKRFYVCQAG